MERRLQLIFAISIAAVLPLAQTHAADKETKKIDDGKKLYKTLNCALCHSIAGTGGCLAPDLNGVTKRHDKKYLQLRLGKNSEDDFVKLIGHAELVPHPRFAATQVDSLISYLNTLNNKVAEQKNPHLAHKASDKSNTQASQPKTRNEQDQAKQLKAGKELFYNGGCLACHSVGGLGGTTAAALDGVSARRNRENIEELLKSPSSAGADIMPRAPLSDSQRESLIDFLMSLAPKN